MGFLAALSVPRLVLLGGQPHHARELRVRDYAALEAVAIDAAGDPTAELSRGDPATYRARLRAALVAAERAEGPGLNEVLARVHATAAGRALLLGMTLRDESLSAGKLTALAESITPEEWSALERVAFGRDAYQEVFDLILAELGIELPRTAGKGVPWARALAEVGRMLHKTPQEIGELTLTEINFVRAGGEPPQRDLARPRGWDDARFDAEVAGPLRKFWEEGEPSGPSAPEPPSECPSPPG